jgi:plasmid stability protein
MASITVRNIPDSVFEKLKLLAEVNRRSLNNELIMAIETGLVELEKRTLKSDHKISPEVQLSAWRDLAGKWIDDRSTEEIIRDIYDSRTFGRDITL